MDPFVAAAFKWPPILHAFGDLSFLTLGFQPPIVAYDRYSFVHTVTSGRLRNENGNKQCFHSEHRNVLFLGHRK